jgi:hypothetical protein
MDKANRSGTWAHTVLLPGNKISIFRLPCIVISNVYYMKRISLAATLIAIVLISSCKKSGTSSIGSWTFAGAKYNASSAGFSTADSSLTATSDGGALSVYFPSLSVRSGTYRIVSYDSIPLDSAQLYIRFIDYGTSLYYFSTGSDIVSAKVTISSAGKINISIPAVYLKSFADPVPDSAQLAGTIYQQ